MPGKVNPVICESVMMVCSAGDRRRHDHYLGGGEREPRSQRDDAGDGAQPAREHPHCSATCADIFAEKCVSGIVANEERCRELVELSMAMVTSLAPKIGYDRAAEIAKESAQTGKTVRQICAREKVLPEAELNAALDPVAMTEPGGEGSGGG